MSQILLSNCCNFSVVQVGNADGDGGESGGSKTFHYECNNCLEKCETHYATAQ